MGDTARISDLIGKPFYDLWRVVKSKSREHRHFWLSGGRGSLKSTFASVAIIRGILADPNVHAVCFRKCASTLKDSVFEQMLWTINAMGLGRYFTYTLNPLRIVYAPTGQRIIFRGMDDPGKTKSVKLPFGYFKFGWYEEFDQFDGLEEIEDANYSFMRGGDVYRYFYTFNPPESSAHWVNVENATPTKSRHCHFSNYLDVPRKWLGEAFFLEAENLRERNPRRYENKFLGKVTGSGGSVFRNLAIRAIADKEIKGFHNFREGIDWGWVEPFAWMRLHYDRRKRIVYITDEIYGSGIHNRRAAELIKAKGHHPCRIIADCEERKSVVEMSGYGFKITSSKKGGGSVEQGYKWLQAMDAIVIDPSRTPNAHREFSICEYAKDKTGLFIDKYPDRNNHTIDAVRYALEEDSAGDFSGSRLLF